MGSIPLALSVHHFVSSVGSDAGFAAIIGLAILILLYFAQARETKTLRDHAYEATERIHQLEAQVAQLSRSGATGRPAVAQHQTAAAEHAAPGSRAAARVRPASATAPAPAAASSPAAAPAMAPAAPAGVAAPALTAATRLIPTPMPAPAPTATATPGLQPAEPDTRGGVAVAAPVADGPPPATVAGGANGSGTIPRQTPPAALRAHGQPGAGGRSAGATAAGERSGFAPGGPAHTGSRIPRAVMYVVGALAVVVVVVVLLIVTGITNSNSSSRSTATERASNTLPARRGSRAGAVNPATVTVAVLNGTATNGLAHRIAQRLGASGYKQGADTNAPDQTHTATIVAYLPGFRRDALAVARTLKVSPSAVQPVDSNTQAVACPNGTSCNANVVVTVGADLEGTQ